MAKSKKGSPIYWIMGTIVALVCLATLFVIVHPMDGKVSDVEACPIGKVCLSQDEYHSMRQESQKPVQVQYVDRVIDRPTGPSRDYRVLNDPLYPPLNRTDARTHESMERNVRNRDMYVPVNDIQDTYRLVGYLINQEEKRDMGGNTWKLFARQKDRHTSDFYMVPANNNYDIKIPIKDDMVDGTRLRDVYTIPNEIKFKSPMLNTGTYEFVENPKTDFSSSSYM